MRFVNVRNNIAVEKNEKYYLMNDILFEMNMQPACKMIDLIAKIDDSDLKLIDEIIENSKIRSYKFEYRDLNSPIKFPRRNILCVGKNYEEHVVEMNKKMLDIDGVLKAPIIFSKMAETIVGADGKILIKNQTEVDYEVELAIIIGKKCKNIEKEEARKYIFGYSIFNDVSDRELQKKHSQWLLGKSMDTFSIMGPAIVTKDEIDNPLNLEIKLSINGEIRQDSNTSNMIFDVDYIISEISKTVTLLPGDIIATGTPSGVGMGFNPPKYLNKNDKIECYIEKIGKLVNYVE